LDLLQGGRVGRIMFFLPRFVVGGEGGRSGEVTKLDASYGRLPERGEDSPGPEESDISVIATEKGKRKGGSAILPAKAPVREKERGRPLHPPSVLGEEKTKRPSPVGEKRYRYRWKSR